VKALTVALIAGGGYVAWRLLGPALAGQPSSALGAPDAVAASPTPQPTAGTYTIPSVVSPALSARSDNPKGSRIDTTGWQTTSSGKLIIPVASPSNPKDPVPTPTVTRAAVRRSAQPTTVVPSVASPNLPPPKNGPDTTGWQTTSSGKLIIPLAAVLPPAAPTAPTAPAATDPYVPAPSAREPVKASPAYQKTRRDPSYEEVTW
jgi:serine/threonine-protein kinase